jgi:hypothetical protein
MAVLDEKEYQEARKFLALLVGSRTCVHRVIGKNKLFEGLCHPLDYAWGVIIGAGVDRCPCGVWSFSSEFQEFDGNGIPACPHKEDRE